jgi:hypothetical protein
MKRPIHKAIAEVLREAGKPMLAEEIYKAITESNLYDFQAQDPLHVVKGQLRRHCKGLNFPSARAMKYFAMDESGYFHLLDQPERVPPSLYKVSTRSGGRETTSLVSIPIDDQDAGHESPSCPESPSHTEIQWRLLDLGYQMGLSVWAPMSDRGKSWNGKRLGDVPKILPKLPIFGFPTPVTKTIENIDVLWFSEKKAIVAGFEIEHTSTIYSGLLRMSDLLTMQPNLVIKMYLVAPDQRLEKYAREVARPTFSSLAKPLSSICRFLPYTPLLERLERAKDLLHHLKPQFLDDIAEVCSPSDEFEEP